MQNYTADLTGHLHSMLSYCIAVTRMDKLTASAMRKREDEPMLALTYAALRSASSLLSTNSRG